MSQIALPEVKAGSNIKSFVPYAVIGAILFLCSQVILWFRLVGLGIRAWPFMWTHAQVSVIQLLVGTEGVVLPESAWVISYIVLTFLLWLGIEKGIRRQEKPSWLAACLGWVGTQVVFGILVLVLVALGILEME